MPEEKSSSKINKLPLVEIGVPCYGPQPASWWQRFAVNIMAEHMNTVEITAISVSMSMLPDDNKNNIAEMSFRGQLAHSMHRKHQTDVNRNQLARWFNKPETNPQNKDKKVAEWLIMVDADTKPPTGFMGHLVRLQRQIASGLYFLPKAPFNPVAYYRRSDGLYEAFFNYQLGTLTEVDSIGMGCVAIHRSVFEEMVKNFTVYEKRHNGAMVPVFNDDIKNTNRFTGKTKHPYISNGILHTPMNPVDWEKETSPWPFFALEYARTEDHFFCENAARIGIKPYLDTNIVCEHQKIKDFGEADYQLHRAEYAEKLQRKVRSHGQNEE